APAAVTRPAPEFPSQLAAPATVYAYAPAGRSKEAVEIPEAGSGVSWAAWQSGCQSPGQPIAALCEPGTVTESAPIAPAPSSGPAAEGSGPRACTGGAVPRSAPAATVRALSIAIRRAEGERVGSRGGRDGMRGLLCPSTGLGGADGEGRQER